jgi:hypothetical protein
LTYVKRFNSDLFHEGVAMTGSAIPTERLLSTEQFFGLAKTRLSLDVPQALANPNITPHLADQDADPALLAAIAATRPVRTAAVLVPVVERREPTVLFTQRTSQLADHAGARLQQLCEKPRRRSVSTATLLSRSAISTST